MITYKQMHSILLKDGRKHLVDVDDWATSQLRGINDEEYDQFCNDFINEITPFYQELMDSGYFITNDITETIPGSDVRVVVGRTHTWAGPGEPQHHEKYWFWQDKFAADPAVTYNPPVLIE